MIIVIAELTTRIGNILKVMPCYKCFDLFSSPTFFNNRQTEPSSFRIRTKFYLKYITTKRSYSASLLPVVKFI